MERAHLVFSVGPRGVDGRADRFMLYFVNTGTQIGLRIRLKADVLIFRFDDGVRTKYPCLCSAGCSPTMQDIQHDSVHFGACRPTPCVLAEADMNITTGNH